MRSTLRAIIRCRPRFLTLVVLVLVAAMIVLANLTFDEGPGAGGHTQFKSYGWPLIWHRYIIVSWGMDVSRTAGWYYSASRLTANLALWLLMLVAPAAACEWLLRRYLPRLRWSLRTMLIAVGLAAVLCGWFAAVRDRASLQDPIIAARRVGWGSNWVSVKRWGPKWLDLLGLDPFRRRIVTANEGRLPLQGDDDDDVRFMEQLAQLQTLKSLNYMVTRLPPDMAESLNGMRGLRRLAITLEALGDHDVSPSDARLPPIKLAQLEVLSLEGVTIASDSLKGLANLKLLSVQSAYWQERDETIWRECLTAVGKLTQLEHLELWSMKISGAGLDCLAGLTNLKTLRLGTFTSPNRAYSRIYLRCRDSRRLT